MQNEVFLSIQSPSLFRVRNQTAKLGPNRLVANTRCANTRCCRMRPPHNKAKSMVGRCSAQCFLAFTCNQEKARTANSLLQSRRTTCLLAPMRCHAGRSGSVQCHAWQQTLPPSLVRAGGKRKLHAMQRACEAEHVKAAEVSRNQVKCNAMHSRVGSLTKHP